ncbi:MAG: type IV toxin-antitoxin system AbiEi family antitoxin [Actinomycetota bacterium]|nr:type IV toxin-antitoxin system AbiEi family antitoxin [Actinomycetota bacterium]
MVEISRAGKIVSQALDGVVVEPAAGDARADLVVRTRDGATMTIEVKWAGEGWPQDVRRAAADVPDPWPADVWLLAHHLSPGAIEWLRERGANWADASGQARIHGPRGLIVIREPSGADSAPKPPRRFTWSLSAMIVAEAILATADRPLHATELAEQSGWSVPQVANVLAAFDSEGWTVKRGAARGPRAHRDLVEADAMLGSWSEAITAKPRRTRTAHRAGRDVMRLLREELAPALNRDVRWALSGWGALELTAPFATTTPSLHVYVSDSDFAGALSEALVHAALREVDEGGRVTFWPVDARALAFAAERDGIPVASPPRVYADLIGFGARGLDAAAHLKDQTIDPLHPTSRGADSSEVADG